MQQTLHMMALLVKDYDEAIHFYVHKLGFELLEDSVQSETKRWVVVCPNGNAGARILLAKAVGEEQLSRVGNQTGGRVFLFMYTDDFDQFYQILKRENITIIRERSDEVYGTVCVFSDLYGNLWDLIQPK